jgi:hypothetical protein
MREDWELPHNMLKNTGNEWLMHMLQDLSEMQRATTMMTIWRIWNAHNEMTHGKPCPSIEGSCRFLRSYMNSLLMIKQCPKRDIAKGKMVISETQGYRIKELGHNKTKDRNQTWIPPVMGKAKLNVDGSYDEANGAGVGMTLRDHSGQMIYVSCRHLEQ